LELEVSETPSDYEPRLHEIVKEARAILEHAQEAVQHFRDGDLKAVSQILSLSDYKVGAYVHCKNEMLKRLAEDGVTPGS
jgi:hypothetical protein